MEKKLKSAYTIRFSDCDLFGHLNNGRYIDYFLNAREDHLKTYYDLDLRTFHQQGLSWFVGGHEILYLKPAFYNERVIVHSALIQADDTLLVEMLMTDEQETHIKSICRTRFIPVNVKTGKKQSHPEDFMAFANTVLVDDVDVNASLKERVSILLAELKQKAVTA